jgi:negative regulator of sigma E activity
MGGTSRFDGAGIGGGDEDAAADAMARELEAVAGQSHVTPAEDFTDRVMAAVLAEPAPKPVAAFGAAVMAANARRAIVAIGDAWRVVFSGSRPVAIRAQALALVLVVAIGAIGIGSAAVAGASALFAPSTPPPSVAPPSAPPVTPSPTPSDSPLTPSPVATPTP